VSSDIGVPFGGGSRHRRRRGGGWNGFDRV
jgi:hypothetical protein